jgi:hypothetical protein
LASSLGITWDRESLEIAAKAAELQHGRELLRVVAAKALARIVEGTEQLEFTSPISASFVEDISDHHQVIKAELGIQQALKVIVDLSERRCERIHIGEVFAWLRLALNADKVPKRTDREAAACGASITKCWKKRRSVLGLEAVPRWMSHSVAALDRAAITVEHFIKMFTERRREDTRYSHKKPRDRVVSEPSSDTSSTARDGPHAPSPARRSGSPVRH